MLTISLFTREGRFVVNVLSPPWQLMPEAIMWGSRTFFWNREQEQYREGLMVYVTQEATDQHGPVRTRAS